MPASTSRAAARVLEIFFPPLCLLCDARVAPELRPEVCASCRSSFRRTGPPGCQRCGAPRDGPAASCRHCAEWSALAQARAALFYAGAVRTWVQRLKYGGVTGLAAIVAEPMQSALREAPPEWASAAALVPVPLHAARLRERGFNQSELMAAALARQIGVPLQTLLRRARPTVSQVGLSSAERRLNVGGAFEVPAELRALCAGRRLVLVDDVLTTGSTLDAAAAALRSAGAGSVFALAAARSLPGRDA